MQFGRFFLYLWIPFMKRPEVFQGERMLFNGNEMQSPAAPRIAAPRLPRREEIDAEAEAGLEDDEGLASAPALREGVSLQENMIRLCRAAGGAVIEVAESFRVWNAFLVSRTGGDERLQHALLCVQQASSPNCRAQAPRRWI